MMFELILDTPKASQVTPLITIAYFFQLLISLLIVFCLIFLLISILISTIKRDKNKKVNRSQILKDFFLFDIFIISSIIKALYLSGFIVINGFCIFAIFSPTLHTNGYSPLLIIVIMIIANIFWRLTCEGIIVFYSINDKLKEISINLKK
jgi:hypothetical protein